MGGGVSESDASTGFEALPDFCVLEILQKCAGEDILRFQGVSRWALSVGRMPSLWRRGLEEQFGLDIPQPLSNDYQFLSSLHGRISDGSSKKLLQFRGVMTDGGVQEGRDLFWVDNMFARKPHSTYCSDILKERDVRCLGAFKSDGAAGEYSLGHFTGENRRQVMYDETMLKDLKNLSSQNREDSDLVVTREIIVGRMGDISCPVSCGAILVGTKDFNEQSLHSDDNVAKKLYSDASSATLETLSRVKDLDEILERCKKEELPSPRVVGYNAMGEWVEFGGNLIGWKGDFRPVAWFRFFTKEENLKVQKDRFQFFKKEFTKIKTDCDYSEPSQSPSITPDLSEAVGLEDESSQRDSIARLWLEAVLPSNATHRFMLGKEHMKIPLKVPAIGNVVCATLISCENWMEQTWVRGGPNIDINFVYMVGGEVPLVDTKAEEVELDGNPELGLEEGHGEEGVPLFVEHWEQEGELQEEQQQDEDEEDEDLMGWEASGDEADVHLLVDEPILDVRADNLMARINRLWYGGY